jgi:hypothetical protein
MDQKQIDDIANAVIKRLFTHMNGDKVTRLVQETTGYKLSGPGWSAFAIRDIVAEEVAKAEANDALA